MIEVLEPGPLATVQDRGRRGWAALGVPRSGSFDRAAAALANRLVGNDASAALLEITLGGLALRTDRALTFALAGAVCSGPDHGTPVTLRAGSTVRLGRPQVGLRTYLAVRGGVDVAATLGSCATDLLSGLGPDKLAAGTTLAVGDAVVGPPGGTVAAPPRRRNVLRCRPGPRADWFADDAPGLLRTTGWVVRADSDRIGVRLDGPALPRTHGGELPSEPTLPGAVQVPADGRPIVFGPDAPVTGGYPVVAVVDARDLDVAAQLRPGDVVRFAPADPSGRRVTTA